MRVDRFPRVLGRGLGLICSGGGVAVLARQEAGVLRALRHRDAAMAAEHAADDGDLTRVGHGGQPARAERAEACSDGGA